MKRVLTIAVIAGAAALAGCAGEPFPPPPADTPAARERDKALEQNERALDRAEQDDRRARRREEAIRRRAVRRRRAAAPGEKPTEGGPCDPNYSGCVPPLPARIDCDDIDDADKPLEVKKDDPHRLDSNGDGVACEPDPL